MSEPVTFTARLEREDGGVFFVVPIDVRAHFGRARPPVLVTVRGRTWRSTPAVYGGRSYLVVNRGNRAATGVEVGDEIEVTLALDTSPREVDVPADLRAALDADAAAAAEFDALSYSHRKEYVDSVQEARRPETRERRISSCVERVKAGLPQQ